MADYLGILVVVLVVILFINSRNAKRNFTNLKESNEIEKKKIIFDLEQTIKSHYLALNDANQNFANLKESTEIEKQKIKHDLEQDIKLYSLATNNESELDVDKILFEYAKKNKDFNYRSNLVFDGYNIKRQLDHIIICTKGILVIETKNWLDEIHIGNTNYNKIFESYIDKTEQYKFLKSEYTKNSKIEKLFVNHVKFFPDYDNNGKIKKYVLENNYYNKSPFYQVRSASRELKSFIDSETELKNKFGMISNVLYFTDLGELKKGEEVDSIINADKFTSLLNGKSELINYLDSFMSQSDIIAPEIVDKLTKIFKLDFMHG